MYDFDLSKEIATKIHAAPKSCYVNAKTAFLRYKKLHGGWYIEGFAVVPFGSSSTKLDFEHAWIELEDGRIIDPTWVLLKHRDIEYFPGIRLNHEEFKLWRKEKKQFPFFYNFGFGGHTHPVFREARKRAMIAGGYKPKPDYSSFFNTSSISS